MKRIFSVFTLVAFSGMLLTASAQERLFILNEGIWQSDNGRLTYFDNGRVVSNKWYRDVNGTKLGDTPNDIIAVGDNLFAIALNWSNIIQFIDDKGKAVGATEDVPNNRKLAADGRYLYATSFGHSCMVSGREVNFTKGFVAKIDLQTFKTVAACEVGYEPEGIAIYGNRLFVANTGGYAEQETDHDYERTVSVIDPANMTVVRTVDTGQINLYGKLSQAGQYLCINSPGDYYEVPAATIIFDCQAVIDGKADNECFVKLPYAATCSTTTADKKFLAVGSQYSFIEGSYRTDCLTIDPAEVLASGGRSGYEAKMPGTVLADIMAMSRPYGIYVNPYSGYIYATDAGEFTDAGTLVQWNPQGIRQGKYTLYINPGHFAAIKPENWNGINDVTADINDDADTPVYNLQGIRVTKPESGRIYIRGGKKIIF